MGGGKRGNSESEKIFTIFKYILVRKWGQGREGISERKIFKNIEEYF